MAHFAYVNAKGIVEQVIVAEQLDINTGAFGPPNSWVQTSYNTRGGEHPEGRPLRKNFAKIGCIYDPVRDAFYERQPFVSWTLNENTCLWEAPVPLPQDGKLYWWDELNLAWVDNSLRSVNTASIDINTTNDIITLTTASATPTV